MIDSPQVAPPAYEQVLTEKLLQCGLREGGFTVKYESELQSVEIVIERKASASAKHIDCISRTAASEIVTFEDAKLGRAYQHHVFAARQPKMLTDARAELAKYDALDGFPERAKFGSDELFAEALERQCGMKPGTFFIQTSGGLIGQPKLEFASKADEERSSCLMAAVMYVAAKGETFEFGFIGNEAFAPKP